MANAPELWYQVIFQPGVVNKLSLIPPYNECTVNFSCNQHIKVFRAWSIFGIYDGTQKGRKIVEYTNRDANVQLSFNINAENHMKHGEGVYTILFYVENDEGLSNMYSYLMSTEQDSSNLYLYDVNELKLMSIDIAGEPEEEDNLNYLCFTSQQDGSTIKLSTYNFNISLYYSFDKINWQKFDYYSGTYLTLNTGQKIYMKSKALKTYKYSFVMTGKIEANGDVNSINNFGDISKNCFIRLFRNCTSLTTPPELPATTLAESCYNEMFYGCSELVTAPYLPATTLPDHCYDYMFYGCSKLESIKINYTGNFDSSFNNWVKNINTIGTLYYNGSYTTRGDSAIPQNWSVQTFTP